MLFGLARVQLSADAALLLLVLISGAIGSWLHAATSLSTRIGKGELHSGWAAWYAYRILIGAALGAVFYLVLRAGFLKGSGSDTVSAYGVGAIAAFVGLFANTGATTPGTAHLRR